LLKSINDKPDFTDYLPIPATVVEIIPTLDKPYKVLDDYGVAFPWYVTEDEIEPLEEKNTPEGVEEISHG
jgi:hypothetical protein